MLLGTDYPFLDVFWTMLVFFVWVAWFMLLFRVIGDIFRRHDASGFAKVLWLIFVIVVPFLGVFIYLIANNKGMTERNVKAVQKAQEQSEDYIRSVSTKGDPAAQIAQAKQLLDSGAINQQEFDALKQKALAT